ncbi:hypothetical protein AAG906_032342 [Vitis piasezkii]
MKRSTSFRRNEVVAGEVPDLEAAGEYNSTKHKRIRTFDENMHSEPKQKRQKAVSNVVDYSDPFAIPNLLEGLDAGKFGSMTKEIEALCARRMQMLHPYYVMYPSLSYMSTDLGKQQSKKASKLVNRHASHLGHEDVIDLEDDHIVYDVPTATSVADAALPVVIIDSDDEESGDQKVSHPPQEVAWPSFSYQEVILRKPSVGLLANNPVVRDYVESIAPKKEEGSLTASSEIRKDKGLYIAVGERSLAANLEMKNVKGEYVGVEDDMEASEGNLRAKTEDDDLADMWQEFDLALQSSKDVAVDPEEDGKEGEEECEHSFVLKDDIGSVCRICGVVNKSIETIIEYQYSKVKRSRTYMYEPRNTKDREPTDDPSDGLRFSEHSLIVTEIHAHPRHSMQMKPHQVEGFNFLVSNLVADNPGGCILAHAPGSGKTFMIISFMQSFLAKYPQARPLVVLPKGILAIWKKEFLTWQVEDIPLYDFYSVKADSRPQQLEVLKQWVAEKSILFLGYKQFSSIVCGDGASKAAMACQEILLKAPQILILDEGHTPRNENTDVLYSLAKVQTPRKVVLSGTLYQNHVKEVFNILNLVRPKFLKLESSRAIVKRIMSKVDIMGVRKQLKSNAADAFYDLVENTLQKDDNFRRKITVIQDLREMTSKVLHYYKGDFLDELPGLVDFTVLLNLSARQKKEVGNLNKFERKFKKNSVGSAVYLHPQLKYFAEKLAANESKTDEMTYQKKMDEILEQLDVREGVKVKFFLNVLALCQSAGEKLLVFSQYLLPLRFLEKLTMKVKGWSSGKEIFVISGESSSEQREWSMERFNTSPDARVFFGSIKACGEGISLVGASRVLILDVHLNPSVTRQAIGRAFRPGQKKKVHVYKLVAADSPEEEDHNTCFKKELISKMWFEWNEYCGNHEFEAETVNVSDSGDLFLESPLLREDVTVLYKR